MEDSSKFLITLSFGILILAVSVGYLYSLSFRNETIERSWGTAEHNGHTYVTIQMEGYKKGYFGLTHDPDCRCTRLHPPH